MNISAGLGAMLSQFGPEIQRVLLSLKPLVDQPVVRFPYTMDIGAGQVLAAGAANQILTPTDFQFALEWPFEVLEVKFSQDIAHTYRDWRFLIQDQTFNQPMMKASTGTLVADVVDDNTGKWVWKFPWTVRPKGGGLNITATNLDTVNPITVNICFIGNLLIPRS